MLFEVAITTKPTKKEMEEGTASEKLVYGPKAVVAADINSAVIAIMMGEDKPPSFDPNRVNVLIRPFA